MGNQSNMFILFNHTYFNCRPMHTTAQHTKSRATLDARNPGLSTYQRTRFSSRPLRRRRPTRATQVDRGTMVHLVYTIPVKFSMVEFRSRLRGTVVKALL